MLNNKSIVFLTLVLLISASVWGIQTAHKTLEKESDNTVEFVIASQEKQSDLADMYKAARERSMILFRMLLTDDAFELDDLNSEMAEHARSFIKARENYLSHHLTDRESDLLASQDAAVTKFSNQKNRVAELLIDGKVDQAKVLLNDITLPGQNIVLDYISQLIEEGNQVNKQSIQQQISVLNDSSNHFSLTSSLVVGFLLTLVLLINFKAKIKETKLLRNIIEIQKQNEQELTKAKSLAEDANAEKSRFLANMSHELRTPMHAILSFTALSIKRSEDEKVLRYLNNIKSSGTRLTGLLNALLDLSQIEAGKLELHFRQNNLLPLIEKSIAELDSLIKQKNITIDIEAPQEIDAYFDADLITQVIINLLSNAVKFTPDNGLIDIEILNVEPVPESHFSGVVEFIITDNGMGIPEDELTKVFDKFVQSSKSVSKAGGTGLGLPISKEIIVNHKGAIWAESPPQGQDKGSSFHFIIPKK